MSLRIQIITLLFSFLFGSLFYLSIYINKTYIYSNKLYIKLTTSFLICIINTFIYFIILKFLNNGIFHFYYFIMIIFGFYITNMIFKRYRK